jgi:hypothetical protein
MTKRMTYSDAVHLCEVCGIVRINVFPVQGTIQDWHSMGNDQKDAILLAADLWKYRKPKNANGSRGRYFAQYLRNTLERG